MSRVFMRLNRGNARFSPGVIETKPFEASRYLAFPIDNEVWIDDGLDQSKVAAKLTCITTGKSILLSRGVAPGWYLQVEEIPRNWCSSPVQFSIETNQDKQTIGIGTPMRIGLLSYILAGRWGSAIGIFLAAGIFCLIIVPLIAPKRFELPVRLGFSLVVISIGGYLLYLSSRSANLHNHLTIMGSVLAFFPLIYLFLNRKHGIDWLTLKNFFIGFSVQVSFLIAAYFILYKDGSMYFANFAFYPVSGAKDNFLPLMMAKHALQLGGGHPLYLGGWSISDRGIIPAGVTLALLSLLNLQNVFDQTIAAAPIAHAFSAFFQGLVVSFGALALLHLIQPKRVSTLKIAIILASTPLILFNSFFVWPKLTAALRQLLGCIIISLSIKKRDVATMIVGIACLILSALWHTSTILAFPGILLFFVSAHCLGYYHSKAIAEIWKTGKFAIIASVAALIVMYALQDTIEPKSTWTMLFLLTGDQRWGLTLPQIFSQTAAFYEALGFQKWILKKYDMFAALFWVRPWFWDPLRDQLWYFNINSIGSMIAKCRAQQFLSAFASRARARSPDATAHAADQADSRAVS